MRTSLFLKSVVTVLLLAGGLIYFSLAAADDALDSFNRNVSAGWGAASVGGRYAIVGTAANFNVSGSAGRITMPASVTPYSAYLGDVSALDVDISFRVETDKLAAGSGQIAGFAARYVDNGSGYLGRLRLATDGSVWLQAAQELNGQVALLGAEKLVPEVAHIANQAIWVRGQVVGAYPTTIRLKAWADGQREPAAWLYNVADITPSLQAPGAVGLRAYLPSAATNAPVRFSFGEFRVRSIVAASTGQASDTFSRRVPNGWGTASIGGTYRLAGPAADFAADGAAGTIILPAPDATRSAYLPDVSALNVDIRFRVQTDKPAAGGGQLASFVARYIDNGSAYLGRLRLATDGSIRLQAVQEDSHTSRLLGAERAVPGLTNDANHAIWVRGQVVGVNPTTIRLKAWADGQLEPFTWAYSVVDASPSQQAAGTVGLRAYLSPTATNVPVRFSFDELRVINLANADRS